MIERVRNNTIKHITGVGNTIVEVIEQKDLCYAAVTSEDWKKIKFPK